MCSVLSGRTVRSLLTNKTRIIAYGIGIKVILAPDDHFFLRRHPISLPVIRIFFVFKVSRSMTFYVFVKMA